MTRVAIFGSTGSIGSTTLEIIKANPTQLNATAIFANSSVKKFVNQVQYFQPEYAGLNDSAASKEARKLLHGQFNGIWLDSEEIKQYAASGDYDLQMAAVVGVEGLYYTLPAFCQGKKIALANKESLVVGGNFFADYINDSNKTLADYIIPVDSEHSSLFRLLKKVDSTEVKKLVLTASGGPFLNYTLDQLANVSAKDALNHPTWQMGPRISLDSATMVNKACQLDVVVHPQSLVHGILRLSDGTEIFHAAPPDMSYPICYALGAEYASASLKLPDSTQVSSVLSGADYNFLPLDLNRFPAVRLAKEIINDNDNITAASIRFYLANEIAAQAFFDSQLSFKTIVPFIEDSFNQLPLPANFSFAGISNLIENERISLKELIKQYY
jgi:1-deoxy-D-xylulose-5-phosphate reductoisomerase